MRYSPFYYTKRGRKKRVFTLEERRLIERLVGQGVEGMGTTKEKIKYENEQTYKQRVKNGEERREV